MGEGLTGYGQAPATGIEWPRLAIMTWGRIAWLSSEQDVRDAGAEIKAACKKAPDNHELCEVIRWMADDGGQVKPPTLREVIRAVFQVRRQAREAAHMATGPCWLCKGTAWATVRWDKNEPRYSSAVPCTCAAGDAILQFLRLKDRMYANNTPQQDARIESLRQLAARQGREAGLTGAGAALDQMNAASDDINAEMGLEWEG